MSKGDKSRVQNIKAYKECPLWKNLEIKKKAELFGKKITIIVDEEELDIYGNVVENKTND